LAEGGWEKSFVKGGTFKLGAGGELSGRINKDGKKKKKKKKNGSALQKKGLDAGGKGGSAITTHAVRGKKSAF